MGPFLRSRRLLAACTILATAAALAPAAPVAAHGTGGTETLYPATDPYLSRRVQEVTDTADVLLAVQWRPTVSGVVTGIRICLDLTPQQVNSRLPLNGSLWTGAGEKLATGGASEGIEFFAPCFYQVSMSPTRVSANQTYVVGFWLRGGQYSYVPNGFDEARDTTATGHLYAPAGADATAGNGLYAYTSSGSPFPTDSWENADYLVTPAFSPDMHCC